MFIAACVASSNIAAMASAASCSHSTLQAVVTGPYRYECAGTHQHLVATYYENNVEKKVYKLCYLQRKYGQIKQICSNCGYVFSSYESSVGLVHSITT